MSEQLFCLLTVQLNKLVDKTNNIKLIKKFTWK